MYIVCILTNIKYFILIVYTYSDSVYRCIFAMKSAIVLVFSLLICIFQSRNMSTVQDIEKDFHGMSLGREVRFKGHVPIFL